MKTIYLVRHGESVLNAGAFETYIDDFSAPLTELGKRQAEFIAERAKRLLLDVIVASPFERAKQTAAAIANTTGHPVEYNDLFGERKCPSAILGLLKTDPQAKRLIEAGFASSERDEGRVEGVETFDELKRRAGKALQFLQERPKDSILVVGHGFFTRMLIAQVLFQGNFTPQEFAPLVYGFRTNNTGISVLKYDPSDVRRAWWLQVWNDHAHLG